MRPSALRQRAFTAGRQRSQAYIRRYRRRCLLALAPGCLPLTCGAVQEPLQSPYSDVLTKTFFPPLTGHWSGRAAAAVTGCGRISLAPPYRPAGCRARKRPALAPIGHGRFGAIPSGHLGGFGLAGLPCTRRLTGRGRRQRCRASSVDRGRVSPALWSRLRRDHGRSAPLTRGRRGVTRSNHKFICGATGPAYPGLLS